MARRTFQWRTWAGNDRTTQADGIIFEARHVVFCNDNGTIVLAEHVDNVRSVTELVDEDGA